MIFGIKWVLGTQVYSRPSTGNATPNDNKLTHLAVTAPSNAETLAAIAQCNTYDPWMSMVRCNLSDTGIVASTYGGRCYTDTEVDKMGQVMVKLKKFWYTTDFTTAGTYIWFISNTGTDTLPTGADHAWAVHPAFIRDGVTKPYIYIAAFEGHKNAVTNELESKAGVAVSASQTLAQFRTAAQLRAGAVANKWEVQDITTTSAIQLLYLMEYGNFDAQLVIGFGYTGMAAASLTGATIANGNASYGISADDDHPMSYRGIENIYGNLVEFIDGVNVQDLSVYIADHDFVSDTWADPYTDTTINLINSAGGWVTDIGITATYDYTFLPIAVGGATTTYLCDSTNTTAVAENVGLFGGHWTDTTNAGMFRYRFDYTSVQAQAYITARLMYIG